MSSEKLDRDALVHQNRELIRIVRRVAAITSFVFQAYYPIKEMKGRSDGYFCSTNKMGIPLLIFGVGRLTQNETMLNLRLCQEKAARLATNLFVGHHSSFESRNERHGENPGAIYLQDHIFSFSGFMPPLLDEAAMLVVAEEYFGVEKVRNETEFIAELSTNLHYHQLHYFMTIDHAREF